MRFVEPDGQEERPVTILFEEPNSLASVLAVGLVLVIPIGRQPTAPADPAAGEVASLALPAPLRGMVRT